MGSFSKNAALLTLGFWLGCAIMFAAVVAPALFNPDVASGLSRPMAGAISGAILRRIYVITYACGGLAIFFLLIASFGELKGAKGPRRALIFCVLLIGLNALNDLWIHDRINKIRVSMANPDTGKAETLREEFDRWHQVSTWVYGCAVLFGALAAISLLPGAAAGKSGGKTQGSKKK